MLNKPIILALLVLFSFCCLFGYLSYSFYGKLQSAEALNKGLIQQLKDCERQKDQAREDVKSVSDGLDAALEANEKISDDFDKLQAELKKKRCPVRVTSDAKENSSSDPYVSDVVRLLKRGADSAKGNGVSKPPISSSERL